jgi:drug/metabolite transporter (DMT)-like permease
MSRPLARWQVGVLLTVPPLMWAGNAVVGRLLVGQVSPLALNCVRWLIVIVLLLPFAWRALLPLSRLRERWLYLAVVGMLGVGLYNALQYSALVTSSPINVTLVAASLPVWMLAVGALFFGEHPSRRQLLGAAIGLVGVLVVIGRGSLATLLSVQFVTGDLLILAATIGWAFYAWLLARPPAHMQGSRRPADWNWAAFLLIQALFGVIASGVFAAGEAAAGALIFELNATTLAGLAYVSIGASIVAYRCFGLGVAEGGPALASLFNNFTPLFAALMSAWWLGERPEPFHAVAFVLIVAGLVVGSRGSR